MCTTVHAIARTLLLPIAVSVLLFAGCGGGGTANECDLCTLAEHLTALGTPGPTADPCATGHGADGHRLECASCESNCAPQAASLRCGNDTDSSVCADGIY